MTVTKTLGTGVEADTHIESERGRNGPSECRNLENALAGDYSINRIKSVG